MTKSNLNKVRKIMWTFGVKIDEHMVGQSNRIELYMVVVDADALYFYDALKTTDLREYIGKLTDENRDRQLDAFAKFILEHYDNDIIGNDMPKDYQLELDEEPEPFILPAIDEYPLMVS